MTAEGARTRVTIRFEACLPHARWGPLFHVFRLEHPGVRLDWTATGFPARDDPLLGSADVGLFLEPPAQDGFAALTLDVSPMAVIVPAGDRLADHDRTRVADILDRSFPGTPSLHPAWTAFWTLVEQRGGPPQFTDDDVRTAEHALHVVAAGRAIATMSTTVATGLAHPGVIALPLRDGPPIRTRLVWRSGDDNPAVNALIDLATAWTQVRSATERRAP
jgi:DNA-binding transcriptional LysR family regulator